MVKHKDVFWHEKDIDILINKNYPATMFKLVIISKIICKINDKRFYRIN